MIRNFEEFNDLQSKNAPMIMLKSREDRGGYLNKVVNTDKELFQPVIVPSVEGGFKKKYCEEY